MLIVNLMHYITYLRPYMSISNAWKMKNVFFCYDYYEILKYIQNYTDESAL